MTISEYRKIQIEQRKLEEKLDEIAKRHAHKPLGSFGNPSYCMHTPPKAMRALGERSRNRKA